MILYLAIFVGTLALSGLAAAGVKSAFAKGKQVPLSSGYTGREIAEMIVRQKGLDCNVVETPGMLSDHYNPMSKTLALSPDVYHGRTAAAAGLPPTKSAMPCSTPPAARACGPSVLAPVAGLGSGLGPLTGCPWRGLGGYQQAMANSPGIAFYVAWAGVIIRHRHPVHLGHGPQRIQRQPPRQGGAARNGHHSTRR